MPTYYVKNGGNNLLDGLSDANAWETIGKVNSSMGVFVAGDSVLFKRGSDFTGQGRIYWTVAGSAVSPITIGAYDAGVDPILDNTAAVGGNDCIDIVGVPYIIIENLTILGAPGIGIKADGTGASNLIIQDCDVSGCNICIRLEGAGSLVTRNYIHDPIRNADSGAIGVIIYRGNNEVSYNTIENCIGDYLAVTDGCGVEIICVSLVTALTDCEIHHNWIFNCFCAFELGANPAGGDVEDNIIHHNVCVNNQGRFVMASTTGGTWEADLSGNQVHNNTVVQSIVATETPARIINVAGVSATGEIRFANNVIYCVDSSVDTIWDDEFDEDHNCYRYGGTTTLGIVADATSIEDDPEFTNLGGEDFTLLVTSPCINTGADLGYAIDYNDDPIDALPDMGAYEYQFTQVSTDIVVVTTRVVCNTAIGDQTILTSKLLGLEPKAARFVATRAVTDGTPANHAALSIGAATAVAEQWVWGCVSEGDQADTDTERQGMTDECIFIPFGNGGIDGEASFVEFVTNGCTINWGDAPASAFLLTVTFYAGDDLTAHAGTFTAADAIDGDVDVSGVGFEPDLIYFATGGMAIDAGMSTGAYHSFGVAANDGSDTQRAHMFTSRTAVAATDVHGYFTELYAVGQLSAAGAGVVWAGLIGNWYGDGFHCITKVGASGGLDDVGYLALAFNGAVDFFVGTINSPIAIGDQSPTTGILPQYVCVGLTQIATAESYDGTGDAGSFGISSFDAYSAYCTSCQDEDAADPTDTQSLSNDQVIDFPLDDGTAAHVATFVSFNAASFTWNFSDTEGTAKKWWMAVIGAVPIVPILRVWRNTLLRM